MSGPNADRAPRAERIIRLDYPVEATTADGTLATIEAVAPDDKARFFSGLLWPLGQKAARMIWSRTGQAVSGGRGLDIDPDDPDVSPILKQVGD